MDCFIRSQLCCCKNAKKICMRVRGWTALKIKQSKNVQQTKPGNVERRRPLMKPAGPGPDRQRRGRRGRIDRGRDPWGWVEKRGKKRGKGSKTCRMYGHPGSSIVSGGSSRCISSKVCRKT